MVYFDVKSVQKQTPFYNILSSTPPSSGKKKPHSISLTLQSVRSVAQFCPALCDPMDCSNPGFPVYHQFPQLAQTHVLRVGDPNLIKSHEG